MTACGKAAAFGRAGAARAGGLGLDAHGSHDCRHAGEQIQAECFLHCRFSFFVAGCLSFRGCRGFALPVVPASAQLSSATALAALELDVLPACEAPDVATGPLPGVTVTVEPSGIVVVPLNPPGPVVTVLDMPLFGDGAVRRDEVASRSRLSRADGPDDALADEALDELPVALDAVAQERLAFLSLDLACAGRMAAVKTTATNAPAARGRDDVRFMILTPPE